MVVQVAKALAGKLGGYGVSARALDAQVRAMTQALDCPGGPWGIGVMLTTNKHIHQLNRKYRQKDKPTDILSFPFHKIKAPGRFPRVKAAEERYLGDLYISLAYVQKQCEPEGDLQGECTVRERLPVLVAHGICHLLGYDHERDADYLLMAKAEEYLLSRYTQFLPEGERSSP